MVAHAPNRETIRLSSWQRICGKKVPNFELKFSKYRPNIDLHLLAKRLKKKVPYFDLNLLVERLKKVPNFDFQLLPEKIK